MVSSKAVVIFRKRRVFFMAIKELRAATGMTQKQFSEYLNIPHRTIQNWEGEQRQCPEYVVELIEYKLRNENLIDIQKRVVE